MKNKDLRGITAYKRDTYYRLKNRSKAKIKLVFHQEVPNQTPEATRTLGPGKSFAIRGETLYDNSELQDSVHHYVTIGELSVRDLDLKLHRNYIIRNKTARRIAIK